MCAHTEKTTHCHVFDIHVSLSLQLSYYVSVEPLKLQVKRRRKDKREERIGRHTGYYKLDGWMEGYSLSSFAVSRKQGKMLQVSWRKMENDHLKSVSVWGREPSPRLRLWMSQIQSVGMPTVFSQMLSSSLPLISVRESKRSPCCDAVSAPTRSRSMMWKTPSLKTDDHRDCSIHNTVIRLTLWPELMLWVINSRPLTTEPTHWCRLQQCLRRVPPNFSASCSCFLVYFQALASFICTKLVQHSIKIMRPTCCDLFKRS